MTNRPIPLTDSSLDFEGIRHGFFTRVGGVSDGIYAGLNTGLGSSDDRAKVTRNRERAADTFGLPGDALTSLYQIHSAEVAVIDRPLSWKEQPKADGVATNRPGVMLGIATADCAPILFADAEAGVVGACHAGWKGALTGVIEATVDAMEDLGADRDRIAGVLGPCIHQASYEVGPEYRERFIAAEAAAERFFAPSKTPGHHLFDLPGYVRDRMARSGIAQVGHVAEDTYADPDRFFSYRRATHRDERNADGNIDYGRLLSAIALTP